MISSLACFSKLRVACLLLRTPALKTHTPLQGIFHFSFFPLGSEIRDVRTCGTVWHGTAQAWCTEKRKNKTNKILGNQATTNIISKKELDIENDGNFWTQSHTIKDVLLHHSRHLSQKRAFIFVNGNGEEEDSITYGELFVCATAAARRLSENHNVGHGDRVLLVFLAGIDFLVAFFACQFSGAIAVPVYPPDPRKLTEGASKIWSIVEDCDPKLLLTTTGYRRLLLAGQLRSPLAGFQIQKLNWVTMNYREFSGSASSSISPDLPTHDVSFLQYTSGSTGMPKVR